MEKLIKAIDKAVKSLREDGKQIVRAKVISERVMSMENIEVSEKFVRKFLTKHLKLSFVKSKKLMPQANSERSLVLRQ